MRTIVITGGTGDLGSVVVPRLAREYRCHVVTRGASDAAKVKTSDNVTTVEGLDGVRKLGPVYALVHLVGGFTMSSERDDFLRMFDTNVMPFVDTLDATTLEDGGRVVAVSAAISLTRPASLKAYVMTKSALNALVEMTAQELKPRGITVNAVLPGTMNTPGNLGSAKPEQLVPTVRVAETIAVLLSDQAAAITGQLVAITV